MKEVISGKKLREKILESIDILCDSVSSTLGPTGNNVLINTDDLSPYITNDGYTIAKSIESDDKVINTILEIAKEASLKTNEEVGDGTTTTLVLLKKLFYLGMEEIEKGKNPIILKKELNEALDEAIKELNKLKKDAKESDLLKVALNTSEDKQIAKILTEVYLKMKSKYACILKESNTEETYYEIKKGYNLEIDNIPSIYFSDNKEIHLNNSYILLLKGYLSDLESISDIINEGLNRNKNIIILVEDYDIEIEREIVLYYLQENKNIYIFKTPDYASRKEAITKDIASLTNSKIRDINLEKVDFSDLGLIKELIIKKDEITLITDQDVTERINTIKEELKECDSDYDKEFLNTRLAKLDSGIATIYVGGKTKTEIKEKLLHFEDCLCSLETATRSGIVLGEGITYLQVIDKISNKILKETLLAPFEKIVENIGEDITDIKEKIVKSNYKKVYNFETNVLEDINTTSIIDPLMVLTTSLKNAVSIASLLLTTKCLVINENIKIEKPIL